MTVISSPVAPLMESGALLSEFATSVGVHGSGVHVTEVKLPSVGWGASAWHVAEALPE